MKASPSSWLMGSQKANTNPRKPTQQQHNSKRTINTIAQTGNFLGGAAGDWICGGIPTGSFIVNC